MAASFSHKLFALNAVVTVFIVGGTLSSPILDMFDGFGEQDGVVPEAVRRAGVCGSARIALGSTLSDPSAGLTKPLFSCIWHDLWFLSLIVLCLFTTLSQSPLLLGWRRRGCGII